MLSIFTNYFYMAGLTEQSQNLFSTKFKQ